MFFSCLISLFSPLARFFIRKIGGLENLPGQGAYIIAVNHTSFADPIFLDVALKQKIKGRIKNLYTIAKSKIIWKIFSLKLSEKLFNILLIDPADKRRVIREGEKILKNNGIVVIFIEGTRTWTGEMQKPKTGAARLALRTRMPIIPAGLRGTYEFWNRNKLLPRYYRGVEVHIGPKIDLENYYNQKITKTLLNRASQDIAKGIKNLLK